GSYYAPEDLLERLERRSQILLRYCDPDGQITRESNPNGSLGSIAGICSEGRNVFGLMPHPERCCEDLLGGTDGVYIFRSILRGLRTEGSGLRARPDPVLSPQSSVQETR
ncbi:MAG: phosphoribosylformylglycinamidine synthase subunit PurQ, partial [Chloroflexota bacterium]